MLICSKNSALILLKNPMEEIYYEVMVKNNDDSFIFECQKLFTSGDLSKEPS